MSEIIEKSLPALRLARATALVPSRREIPYVVGPLVDTVSAALGSAAIAPVGHLVAWYVPEGEGMLVSVGYPVDVEHVPGLEVEQLPAVVRALCLTHLGPTEGLGESWRALMEAVASRGESMSGAGREVYLSTPVDDPASWVTELQQPV